MQDQLLYQIAITKVPKVGPVIGKNLIRHCGNAAAVFEASKKELLAIPGVHLTAAEAIRSANILQEAEQELDFIEKHRIKPLFFLDEAYPQRLTNHNDCPLLMYYKGNTNLNSARVVAIVGTRKPTPYGFSVCEELVEGLAAYNVLIVSGLALGIDGTAHKKCVEMGIENIGVLGHGLNRIYPAAHKQLAGQMIENGGVLTEFRSDQGPEREHFPMRNRIIAGMCDALVVVETARKGGSMISAEIANNYFKDVYAIPGRVKDNVSNGCNHLIKTNKAGLIQNADDLAYAMSWEKSNDKEQVFVQVETNEKERVVLDLLRTNEGLEIDALLNASQFKAGEMAALLLGLEFKGLVKPLPGKRFMLLK